MKKFSTGELAKACGVSNRTVQFYDEKGLLKPTIIKESGWREYSEEDLQKLKLICLYKQFGFTLAMIKKIMATQIENKTMLALLTEQENILLAKKAELDEQYNKLKFIKESLTDSEALVTSMDYDIERIVKNKRKLRNIHIIMLVLGIIADILQICTIVLWVVKGIWWPFVVMLPIVIGIAVFMTAIYIRGTIYLCPDCLTKITPTIKEYLFAKHTAKTRKVYCPQCKSKKYAIEIHSDNKG